MEGRKDSEKGLLSNWAAPRTGHHVRTLNSFYYTTQTRSIESWIGKTKINMEGANGSDVDAHSSER